VPGSAQGAQKVPVAKAAGTDDNQYKSLLNQ